MAALSYNSIAESIYAVLKGKSPAEQKQLLPGVVRFLARRKLIAKSEEILTRLQKIMDREEGRVTAKVTSGLPLHQGAKSKIREDLKQRYKVKDVALEEKIDARLLGGFKIEIGDEVIDLSVRNKMNKLQEHLTKGAR